MTQNYYWMGEVLPLHSILTKIETRLRVLEESAMPATVQAPVQAPDCWHCRRAPRLQDQILCESCVILASEEMSDSGVLANAMKLWRPTSPSVPEAATCEHLMLRQHPESDAHNRNSVGWWSVGNRATCIHCNEKLILDWVPESGSK